MPLLGENDRNELRKLFSKLKHPVKLVTFTQEINCEYCKEAELLVNEVADLSPLITSNVYNFVTDKDKVEQYKVDKVPAIAICDEKDYGIRFYGMPSGYEFTTLIRDILMVSTQMTELSDESLRKLEAINTPVHIQVFVTPTCPYCPAAVYLAHQIAFVNDHITADMVEALEFMELAQKYNVYGVPKIVINDEIMFEGALPEPAYVDEVLKATKRIIQP